MTDLHSRPGSISVPCPQGLQFCPAKIIFQVVQIPWQCYRIDVITCCWHPMQGPQTSSARFIENIPYPAEHLINFEDVIAKNVKCLRVEFNYYDWHVLGDSCQTSPQKLYFSALYVNLQDVQSGYPVRLHEFVESAALNFMNNLIDR